MKKIVNQIKRFYSNVVKGMKRFMERAADRATAPLARRLKGGEEDELV